MFEHKGPLLNFSPQHHINGKGEKFKLGTCQRGKFSEAAQSCDAVVFGRRSKASPQLSVKSSFQFSFTE